MISVNICSSVYETTPLCGFASLTHTSWASIKPNAMELHQSFGVVAVQLSWRCI